VNRATVSRRRLASDRFFAGTLVATIDSIAILNAGLARWLACAGPGEDDTLVCQLSCQIVRRRESRQSRHISTIGEARASAIAILNLDRVGGIASWVLLREICRQCVRVSLQIR